MLPAGGQCRPPVSDPAAVRGMGRRPAWTRRPAADPLRSGDQPDLLSCSVSSSTSEDLSWS